MIFISFQIKIEYPESFKKKMRAFWIRAAIYGAVYIYCFITLGMMISNSK